MPYTLIMATFSFSHTGNYWKTRYSFEPTEYTCVDNTMVSYQYIGSDESDSNDVQQVVWRHNEGIKNNFYGTQYNSSFVVVSNNDPSAEKVFNAISLESNQNAFSSQLFTNVDLPDTSETAQQQGSVIQDFIPKEENLYAQIPPSSINSTSNFRPVGVVSGYDVSNNQITVQGMASDVPYGASPVYVTTFDDGSTVYSSVVNPGQGGILLTTHNTNVTPESVLLQAALNPGSSFEDATYNPNQNTTSINVGGSGVFNGAYIVENQTILMYALDPSIHGDSMRGKYLLASFTTKDGSKPFELYAINVDYSFSNLDSRLGQNP